MRLACGIRTPSRRNEIKRSDEVTMLTDVDLLAWCSKTGLVDGARIVVDHIRSSDPARRVGGGRRNVSGRYPSRKMGVIIQFESHRVELAAVYELEHDPDVLEYFDQPPSF